MTIFRKSLLTLSIAALIFSIVFAVFSVIFMNSLYYEINTIGLKNTAETLLTVIGKDRVVKLFKEHSDSSTFIEGFELPVDNFSEYRLTLIAPSGYVLWDSHVTDRLVNHIDREEVTAALQGNEASARRNSISTDSKLIYYALPVFDNSGKSIGVFRLSASVPSFRVRVSPVILPFLFYSSFLVIIAFCAIFAYSRSLADSVGRLATIARSSAPLLSGPEAGEFIAPEFRSLERALRAMTSELNMRFEQIKSERARLEAILNGMTEAVFAMDSDLKLHLVNPRARELFNIKNGTVNDSGKSKLTLLETTHSADLEDIAKKALAADTSLETEITFRTGAEQYFQVYASKLEEINGKVGVVLVLQDVTRLVKLERVRKDFVANVSHELRTPIQLIKGFSETLYDTVNDNGSKKQILHFVEIIQKNTNNMENLTNDLLILADLENNGVNSRNTEEVFILPLIKEAVSSVETQAKRKNIEIITDCPDNLKAKLYGSFIIQALINLIDNAIKYSPSKSKIRVNAVVTENGNELLLEVRDKGIGIPQDQHERIFERFYRVDKAKKFCPDGQREAGGTGLGLSIVRHIALMHGGKAEVESHIGEGSVFRLRIPLREL